MSRGAYYNELDPYAAQWLRNLIAAGHIAPGDVDARSIKEVQPDDLKGYAQAHFFAGIGVWSHALRLAGWPDDSEVWTGSCPCQPFSAAGKQKGFDDERHLWPDWFRLIAERRPSVIFGEQVAHKSALPWVDAVLSDLEGAGYSGGASDLCAAGIGAPHIRQRLYFVADRDGERLPRRRESNCQSNGPEQQASRRDDSGRRGEVSRLADSHERASEQGRADSRGRIAGGDAQSRARPGGSGEYGGLAVGNDAGLEVFSKQPSRQEFASAKRSGAPCVLGNADEDASGRNAGAILDAQGEVGRALWSCTNGPWATSEFVYCRDGRYRPVEPGSFPLANGVTNRVGRLRAYGNAIAGPLAAEFILAYRETRP